MSYVQPHNTADVKLKGFEQTSFRQDGQQLPQFLRADSPKKIPEHKKNTIADAHCTHSLSQSRSKDKAKLCAIVAVLFSSPPHELTVYGS